MPDNKFFIIKREDAEKYLDDHQVDAFKGILTTIISGRQKDNKDDHFYAVINTDEPYFPEVKAIMQSNGHWEDDEE